VEVEADMEAVGDSVVVEDSRNNEPVLDYVKAFETDTR
jgi:hypothetical protein